MDENDRLKQLTQNRLEHRKLSVVGQMLTFVEEIAQNQGIISKDALALYREKIMPVAGNLLDTSVPREKMLGDLIKEQHSLAPADKAQIAQLAALESRMLRAIQFYERSQRQLSPKEEFTNNFKEILKRDGIDLDGNAPAAVTRTPHLDAVAKTLSTAQIINVITKHPVEWETDTMRESEWELTKQLKLLIPKLEKSTTDNRIPPDEFAGIEKWTFDIIKKMKAGEDITHYHKNTVPKENASAGTYYKNILDQYDDVANQYNAALADILQNPNLPDAARGKLESMHISEERKKSLYSLRTWALSGDGDGRPDSTDIGLFRGAMQGFVKQEDGSSAYKGPVIDMRHNAEEQRNLLSSAIQRKYLDNQYGKRGEPGTFKVICDEFTEGKKTRKGEDYNPDFNIFQELHHEDQAAFARELLTRDTPAVTLIAKDVKNHVMDFLPFFNEYYNKFLKDHHLPPTTSFKDLRKIPDNTYDKKDPDNKGSGDLWGKLKDGVLQKTLQRRKNKQGVAFMLNNFGSYSPLFAEDNANYFLERKTLSEKGDVVTMTEDQRNFDIGIFRRMAVANNFIEKYGSKDESDHWKSEIFQRYKIANFGHESDFYIAMELFKEAGLITVEHGVVKDAKMGIMPLLETNEDLNNAPEIFGKLLKDDLVRSYWQKRGMAEIMVGYSDSSKSASSGPSQEKIRETKGKLIKLFADSGIDVPLHVHEGPGYGLDRGGVLEAGAAMLRQPKELQERGLYDLTIQGTLPRDMAGYPDYGKHTLASMMIGVTTGAQKAMHQNDPTVAERQVSYDAARKQIFEEAAKDFQEFRARHQPAILQVIGTMPKNTDKSSRPDSRPDNDAKDPSHVYDGTRMIGIEYAFRQSKLPFFEIGLKHGLQKFIDSGTQVPDHNGEMVSGMKALQALFSEDDMFRLQMNLRQISMNGYRKDLAQQWGQLTNTPAFVEEASVKLDGLSPMLAKIREGHLAERVKRDKDGNQVILPEEIKSTTALEALRKERNPRLDYFSNAAHISNTLDMVAQTALLAEAYDPAQQKVVSIASTQAKTMNPKNKRKDSKRIHMLRNYELCNVAPIETQDMSALTADVRNQVEGRAA